MNGISRPQEADSYVFSTSDKQRAVVVRYLKKPEGQVSTIGFN